MDLDFELSSSSAKLSIDGWHELPVEILLLIFQRLEMKDISRAMQVCFRWASAARVEMLWFLAIQKEVWKDLKQFSTVRISFFDLAKRCKSVERNWQALRYKKKTVAQMPKGVIDFVIYDDVVVTCGLSKNLTVVKKDAAGEELSLKGHEHFVVDLLALRRSSLFVACR